MSISPLRNLIITWSSISAEYVNKDATIQDKNSNNYGRPEKFFQGWVKSVFRLYFSGC